VGNGKSRGRRDWLNKDELFQKLSNGTHWGGETLSKDARPTLYRRNQKRKENLFRRGGDVLKVGKGEKQVGEKRSTGSRLKSVKEDSFGDRREEKNLLNDEGQEVQRACADR